jgi:sugar lactone lactonase YvrE
VALGPEATAIDANGRIHTGTSDGRILRLDTGTRSFVEIAATGGRPLGMAFDRSGRLLVCDAVKGLLALSPSGDLSTLATEHAGLAFGFTDDVDVAPDGTAYFTDASSRFGLKQVREDILEHGGSGRLMAFHPETATVDLLLSGLQFANGVAVAGDGSYLLVNETGAYRVTRYWLAGLRRGTSEPFIENLPGLPDNITWSAERHAFWIALYSPRVPALDLLAGHPFIRKVVFRLPLWVQPKPAHQARALAIDEHGTVVEDLEDSAADSFAPVTSVRERDGTLWLGSLESDALGRIKAPPLAASREP